MTPKVVVSDHAVLRYLERQWGVDVEGLRARIARDAQIGVEHGANAVNRGRLKFVLKGRFVATVLNRRATLGEPGGGR